jgi:hypothetical protein
MSGLLSVIAQYEPLYAPISHDAPNDQLSEPHSLLLSLALAVALILGRRRIADFFNSVTGWGPGYHRFCEASCLVWGTLLVVGAVVSAVRLLL